MLDNVVDTEDDSIEAIGVMLTDDDKFELPSANFSSRGRFGFFFIGSFEPVLSKRFPFGSYESDLFSFTLSQSAFVFENFMFFESSVNEFRNVSFNESSFNLCDDLNRPSADWSNSLLAVEKTKENPNLFTVLKW